MKWKRLLPVLILTLGVIWMPFNGSAILLTPEEFGARVDDGKPDDIAFQKMFDAIPENELNVVIQLTPGLYLFEKTVYYPKQNRRRTLIDGNHATIKAVGLKFDLLTPKDMKGEKVNYALTYMDKLMIRDLSFEGGDTQLRLAATLNSEINNCEFVSGNRGIDMVFCLMGRVINCQFTRQKIEQLLVRSGQGDPFTQEAKYFSNATGNNSQSNVVTVDGCRFFANENSHACIRNYASNSMTIENTVFEGFPPRHSVDYHDRNSTTCTFFYMRNIHIEHPYDTLYTKSLIHVEQNGGIVHLDGIYSQTGRTVQVEAGKSMVKLSNWAYVPGSSKFKANGGGQWIFEDVRGLEDYSIRDQSLWVGDPPAYVVQRFGPTTRTHGNWHPTLQSEEDYISITPNRIIQTTDQYFDKGDNYPLKQPRDMDGYEIVDLRPFVVKNPENGKTETYYLPIIAEKGKYKPNQRRKGR